jgi:hypothetical protein
MAKVKKRVIDFRERVINGDPLKATNKQAMIVTSPGSQYSLPPATFAKKKITVTLSEPDKNRAPPGNVRDHRGEIFGKLVVCGYAYSKKDKQRRRSTKNEITKPKWWIGPGWNPGPLRTRGYDWRHYWWCLCLNCKREVTDAISTHGLNKYKLYDGVCHECSGFAIEKEGK